MVFGLPPSVRIYFSTELVDMRNARARGASGASRSRSCHKGAALKRCFVRGGRKTR